MGHEILGLKPVTLKAALALREAGTDVLKTDSIPADDLADIAPWSPMLLCALYASMRNLMRGGRPDCLEAGLEILQKVLDGRVPYMVRPPEGTPEECVGGARRKRKEDEKEE